MRKGSPRVAATQGHDKEGHGKEEFTKKTEVPRRSEENIKNTIKEMQTPASQPVSTKPPASAMNGQCHNQQESSDFYHILSSCNIFKLFYVLELEMKSTIDVLNCAYW